MAGYRVISSDDHVIETPDLWTSRVEPKYRDRAPRIITDNDSDWWYCDGWQITGVSAGTQPGRRFGEPEKLTRADVFENVLPGGYIPEEHIKDMDIDGVDVSIVYPTVGVTLYALPDSNLLTEIFRVYNDWLVEYCRPYPNRLKGIAIVNLDDVHSGIKQLERYGKMGLAGAMIPVYPPEGRAYHLPEYEPFWAAAQDLGIPLSLHISSNRRGEGKEFANLESATPAFITNAAHWVQMSLADMIFSGVFERYPKLQVGSIEMELSWVPHLLDRMDYTYTQRTPREFWHRFKEDMLPSDYFHRNVFVSFQEDGLGVKLRDIIGVDNLMWGSDYPHPESTFPRTRQILEEILADCTEEEKAKVVGGNAARVYVLD